MGVDGALTCGRNGSLTTKCLARTAGAFGVCATAATAAFTGPELISGMKRSRAGVRSTLCGSFGPVVEATATAGVVTGTTVDGADEAAPAEPPEDDEESTPGRTSKPTIASSTTPPTA